MLMTARKIFLPQKEALTNMQVFRKQNCVQHCFPMTFCETPVQINILCQVDDYDNCFFLPLL
jgi:hypothetical protein